MPSGPDMPGIPAISVPESDLLSGRPPIAAYIHAIASIISVW